MATTNRSPGSDLAPLTAETIVELLQLARDGDKQALDRLCQRCVPAVRRWARGRLPHIVAGMPGIPDVVQDAVVAAMRRSEAFEAQHQAALQAYLRQAVMNRIRDAIRQPRAGPARLDLPPDLTDESTSPLERIIGAQNLERYESALQRLEAPDREAIIGRLEMQYSYEHLAIALDEPTPAAARAAVTRAMKLLAEAMQHG
jgi:RNA polymerase sigma-70 factor (ECF subfamily)